MFGKVVRRLASMAVHQVDRAGEKREAWMKAMRSAIVSVGKMELAVWCSSVTVVSGSELGKSSCQRREPVSGERVPDMMGGPVRVMASCVVSKTSTLVELKMAVQPWSQSWPMEISEPEARAGKMCAEPAWRGSEGIGRVAVWLEVMEPPVGTMTEMPGLAMVLFVHWISGVMKCPVLPVSAMAVVLVDGGERACSVWFVEG